MVHAEQQLLRRVAVTLHVRRMVEKKNTYHNRSRPMTTRTHTA